MDRHVCGLHHVPNLVGRGDGLGSLADYSSRSGIDRLGRILVRSSFFFPCQFILTIRENGNRSTTERRDPVALSDAKIESNPAPSSKALQRSVLLLANIGLQLHFPILLDALLHPCLSAVSFWERTRNNIFLGHQQLCRCSFTSRRNPEKDLLGFPSTREGDHQNARGRSFLCTSLNHGL